MKSFPACFVLFPVLALGASDLASTPPMGWNSWNKFGEKIDAATVRATADLMAANGMRAAGYRFINIDDGWQGKRDEQGVLRPNDKFPDMKGLADYVHSKGLKIGIYSSPGPRTCADYEGSYQHEVQDAKTWAEWGIDYLKYDWCSAGKVYPQSEMQPVYKKMGGALLATGRPIVFSLCQYGLNSVWEWGPSVRGNLWRTTGDISDNWKSMSTIGFDKQTGHEKFAAPGHWNDPDMLEIGNGGMTHDEYKTHMSLWAMLAAPLLAGNDLRNMSDETRAVLLNQEVIDVDQDPLGRQGYRISKEGGTEVWIRPLQNGDIIVALFNRNEGMASVRAFWEILNLKGKHKVRDLWKHAELGSVRDMISAEVPQHGVVMLRISH